MRNGDDEPVPTKVERLGAGHVSARSEAVAAFGNRRMLPKRQRPPASLLERMLVRGGVMEPMPDEVRKKAPKRVQEAMKLVEDYVDSLDGKVVPEVK